MAAGDREAGGEGGAGPGPAAHPGGQAGKGRAGPFAARRGEQDGAGAPRPLGSHGPRRQTGGDRGAALPKVR
eukprot:638859-Prorocentrum_minimum.AAC.1